jgi:hypothetical protein
LLTDDSFDLFTDDLFSELWLHEITINPIVNNNAILRILFFIIVDFK